MGAENLASTGIRSPDRARRYTDYAIPAYTTTTTTTNNNNNNNAQNTLAIPKEKTENGRSVAFHGSKTTATKISS
jgi:hypothetical protein